MNAIGSSRGRKCAAIKPRTSSASAKQCSASDETMTDGSCLTPNGSVSLRSQLSYRKRAHINGELATSMNVEKVSLKTGS